MKRNYFITVVLFSLLFSCKNDEKSAPIDRSQLESIIIDVEKGKFLPLDSIVENVGFVKLETADDCLIGSISQLLFTDSLIIIVDKDISKSIFVFNMDGKLKNKVAGIGNGPGEYIEASYVCLVPDKEQITIIDAPQSRVIFYTYDGKYVDMITKMPFLYDYFEYLKSGNIAYNTYSLFDPKLGKNKDNQLILTSPDNEVIYGSFKDIYSDHFHYTKHHILRNFAQNIYFSPIASDTIFEIRDTIVKAKYYIDLGKKKMPKISEDMTDDDFAALLENHFYFNGDFIELKDFTYVNIMLPREYPAAVYSHSKKKTFLSTGTGNHPLFNFLFNNAPKARYKENCIVVDCQSHLIFSQKQELYQYSLYKEQLDSLYMDLDEDSNPVLFFYHLNPDL
jgi:hypothetical protein